MNLVKSNLQVYRLVVNCMKRLAEFAKIVIFLVNYSIIGMTYIGLEVVLQLFSKTFVEIMLRREKN